jgi:hypothetical protein
MARYTIKYRIDNSTGSATISIEGYPTESAVKDKLYRSGYGRAKEFEILSITPA